MSADMRDRLKAEFKKFDDATMDLENAFGMVDDPAVWIGEEDEYAEMWSQAARSAQNVVDTAEALADGARKVVRTLELALDEDAE